MSKEGTLPYRDNCSYKPADPHIPCFQCGTCCSLYRVKLSLEEAMHIAEELGISSDEFLEQYVEAFPYVIDSFCLRQSDGACVFLKPVEGTRLKACSIHPFKPAACREWTSGLHRRGCRDGLIKFWGLRVTASGEIQGPPEKLRDFQSFLQPQGRKQAPI
ncbi:MAG: YkgJ family cysteine cluster protein [Dehalococcoidia bacterium]|nr:YkgJ family cysteine cluster protein [Dehalococcoidia bacterium]